METLNNTTLLLIIVTIIGVTVLAGVIFFAVNTFSSKNSEFFNYSNYIEFMNKTNVRPNMPRYLNEAYSEYLSKRNEFWSTFTQVIIAAFIIFILAVLMLTKVISAEAGLPILSAVSGFAIAKSTKSEKTTSNPSREEY